MEDVRRDPNIDKLIEEGAGVYTPDIPDDYVPDFVTSPPPNDIHGRPARVVIDIDDTGITNMWSSTHSTRTMSILEQAVRVIQQVNMRDRMDANDEQGGAQS